MRAVWKYPLTVGALNHFGMPKDARVVHVGAQGDGPDVVYMWAEVDDDAPTVVRTFAVIGTGRQVPDFYQYVGTAVCGAFVWHVYEEMR